MISQKQKIFVCLSLCCIIHISLELLWSAERQSKDLLYRYFPQPPYLLSGDTLFVIESGAMNEAELLLLSTLAGVVAQKKPAIYFRLGNGYLKWQEDLTAIYGLVLDSKYQYDLWGLLARFKDRLAEPAYLLCQLGQNSENVATSLAGIWGVVAVDASIESHVQAAGLQLKLDVRGKDEAWCFQNYWQDFNPGLLIQQKESLISLRDYSVLAGAFLFFDGNSSFMYQVMDATKNDSPILGWGDASQGEDKFVQPASDNSLFTIPADFAWNLSVFSGLQVDSLFQRTHINDPVPSDFVHTVTFVMSDGDNIQWLMNDFSTHEKWYGSSLRGQFDMGWTISPSLVALAPTILDRLYREAASEPKADFFVCGVSGGGYFYPSFFVDLATHCDRLNGFLKAADLNIVTILEYRRGFFVPAMLDNYTRQSQVIGCFYLDYAQYDYYAGKIVWSNGKPVVSAKFNLWESFDTPEFIAATINRLARNPSQSEAYSYVNVHPWSTSLADVRCTISLFNENVQVVTPEEFIKRIVQHVPHESSGVMDTNFPTNVVKMKFDMYPNPACGYQIQQARIKIYLDSYEIKLPLFVRVFDVLGREISCRQLSEINNNSSFELFRESEFHNQKPMASGIYFVQVAANSTIEYRKLVVLQ